MGESWLALRRTATSLKPPINIWPWHFDVFLIFSCKTSLYYYVHFFFDWALHWIQKLLKVLPY
jgi:hypothetical protein